MEKRGVVSPQDTPDLQRKEAVDPVREKLVKVAGETIAGGITKDDLVDSLKVIRERGIPGC